MQAPAPLYERIRRSLIGRIHDNYKVGEIIPSQEDLARGFGVSLITVKRALAELAAEGYVESVRGRGTVVRSHDPSTFADNHSTISSWTQNLGAMGKSAGTSWSEVQVELPVEASRRLLRMKARQKCIVLRRLRTVDGQIFCRMTNEIPQGLVPGFPKDGLPVESLYAFLSARYGLVPSDADETVEARPATKPEQQWFGRETTTVLQIERISFLPDGTPLERALVVVPAQKYRYSIHIRGVASERTESANAVQPKTGTANVGAANAETRSAGTANAEAASGP